MNLFYVFRDGGFATFVLSLSVLGTIFYAYYGWSLTPEISDQSNGSGWLRRRLSKAQAAWSNIVGSAVGWLVGWWLWKSLTAEQPITGWHLLLLLIAVLGVTGLLPQTLLAVGSRVTDLVNRAGAPKE